MAGQAGQI